MSMKYLNLILVFVFLAFSVKSDQLDSRLTNLFQELYNSTDESQSNQIVEKIWDIWLETNDTEIEKDFYRGIEFLRIGDYTQSIYFLTQVIKKNPNFSEAWNKRATVYFMMGNFDKSMYDIKQTLNLEPRHFGAMDGMGLIFMHMKQYGNALKIYDQMLEIFPNNKSTKDKRKLIKELLLKSA
mgnify:CR=1 FL=1